MTVARILGDEVSLKKTNQMYEASIKARYRAYSTGKVTSLGLRLLCVSSVNNLRIRVKRGTDDCYDDGYGSIVKTSSLSFLPNVLAESITIPRFGK